jgi:hypothetical protein
MTCLTVVLLGVIWKLSREDGHADRSRRNTKKVRMEGETALSQV